MATVRFRFIIAIAVTVMNVWVAHTDAPLLWHVWGDVPSIRVGLLGLAGGSAFTLMDIWSMSIGALRTRQLEMAASDGRTDLTGYANSLERADV